MTFGRQEDQNIVSGIDLSEKGSYTTYDVQKAEKKVVWAGCWYKPWTWFRRRTDTIIKEANLLSLTILPQTATPNRNGDVITWSTANRALNQVFMKHTDAQPPPGLSSRDVE